MLKFKEGKMMLFVMFLIFVVAVTCVFTVPYYNNGNFYKFVVWFFLVDLIILALCQVFFAKKLYKIAKEISLVNSKTEITEDATNNDSK